MESQRAYERVHPITKAQSDYQSQRIQNLRRELSNTRMENRELRQRQYFSSYYGRPTPYYYNDGFNIWFWLWLMDRPQRDRDTWVYNHRDGMDPARLEELKKKDADLENRLRALEAQGVQKDPSYTPPGVDRDLMYSDDFVKNVIAEKPQHHFPWGWVISGVLLVTLMIYLVFFFRPRRRSE